VTNVSMADAPDPGGVSTKPEPTPVLTDTIAFLAGVEDGPSAETLREIATGGVR
jgi:hypothetical protein